MLTPTLKALLLTLIMISGGIASLAQEAEFVQDQKFVVAVDTNKIGLENELSVVYTFYGMPDHMESPRYEDFAIVRGPFQQTSRQTIPVSGKMQMQTTVSITYVLQPLKTGKLVIPPLKASTGEGRSFSTEAITVDVIEGSVIDLNPHRVSMQDMFSDMPDGKMQQKPGYTISTGPVYKVTTVGHIILDSTFISSMLYPAVKTRIDQRTKCRDLGISSWNGNTRMYYSVQDTTGIRSLLAGLYAPDTGHIYATLISMAAAWNMLKESQELQSMCKCYSALDHIGDKQQGRRKKTVAMVFSFPGVDHRSLFSSVVKKLGYKLTDSPTPKSLDPYYDNPYKVTVRKKIRVDKKALYELGAELLNAANEYSGLYDNVIIE